MAYDSNRGKTILFGGRIRSGGGTQINAETWEWDGENWTKLEPSVSPSARFNHSMIYDSKRGKILLFGGETDSGYLDETWEWNGESWSLIAPQNKPSPRSSHSMIYDTALGVAILFGGKTFLGSNDETWVWDGKNWLELTPNKKPSRRWSSAMCYDSAKNRAVLFGGIAEVGNEEEYEINNETWEWDGENWEKLEPENTPSPQYGHSMIFDSSYKKTVMFGGFFSNETWEWNGEDWSLLNLEANPSSRQFMGMVYDSAREKTVLISGMTDFFDSLPIRNETWTWDGEVWLEHASNSELKPSPRSRQGMAYNEATKNVVMFGGCGSGCYNDTWIWNGAKWIKMMPSNFPDVEIDMSIAFNKDREEIILFGGDWDCSDKTWLWNGSNWELLDLPEKPSARINSAMDYDFLRGKIVMFGGELDNFEDINETWEWNGDNWSMIEPQIKPPNTRYPVMAYDSAQEKMVLWTYENNGQVWEWNGVNWTEIPSQNQPSSTSGHKMVYDKLREKMILFGGFGLSEHYNETWEWNGLLWKKLNLLESPTARSSHSMTYDSSNKKILLFGGTNLYGGPLFEQIYYDDFWEWQSVGKDSPGHITIFEWESSGVTDASTVTHKSLSVLFNAGGLGDYSGTPHEGVDLLAWKHDRWVTVAYNEAGPDTLEPVTWETTDPVEIQTLLNSGLRKFNFAVVPTAPNGTLTDMGSIATDYAEVVVRYTITD
ncbi:hypothetical protein KA996_06220 [bacterium]|nr:hypothetical protein [bacterium]